MRAKLLTIAAVLLTATMAGCGGESACERYCPAQCHRMIGCFIGQATVLHSEAPAAETACVRACQADQPTDEGTCQRAEAGLGSLKCAELLERLGI